MLWNEPLKAHLLRLYVILTAALLPFVIWPQIDITVARWFYTPGAGFPLVEAAWLNIIRRTLWNAAILGFVGAVLGTCWTAFRIAPVPGRVWHLMTGFYIAGPILLTHEVFKNNWHRARPANTELFGGTADYTGPLTQPGACLDNCSFISGEVAGATALALAFIWLLPLLRRPASRRGLIALAVALVVASSLIRMATGRHYLSDCVFAVLFMFALWSLLSRLLPPEWHPFAAASKNSKAHFSGFQISRRSAQSSEHSPPSA